MRIDPKGYKTKQAKPETDVNHKRTAALIFVFIGVFYWFYKVVF
ncbi:hypothetical protein [Mucilaginibacter boryungensis]